MHTASDNRHPDRLNTYVHTHALKAIALALSVAAMPLTAVPAELTITNASFEDISGQTLVNEFTLVTPNGWTSFNTNALVEGAGLYLGTLEPDGTFFDPVTNPTPHGARVAILYNQTQKGAGEYGIEQTLVDTLAPYTRYTLHVEVGNIGSGTADNGSFYDLSGFPGYRIDLLASNTVLASDNNALSISERTFETSIIDFIPPVDHASMGDALGIRLVSLNAPSEPDSNNPPYDAHEVDFDNVRLFANPLVTSNQTPYRLLVEAGLVTSNATDAAFNLAAELDTDSDSQLDWQEFVAGSDPTNAQSTFTTSIQTTGTTAVLTWPTTSNRTYSVHISTNLAQGFITNTVAPSGVYIIPTTNNATMYFHLQVTTP